MSKKSEELATKNIDRVKDLFAQNKKSLIAVGLIGAGAAAVLQAIRQANPTFEVEVPLDVTPNGKVETK